MVSQLFSLCPVPIPTSTVDKEPTGVGQCPRGINGESAVRIPNSNINRDKGPEFFFGGEEKSPNGLAHKTPFVACIGPVKSSSMYACVKC